MKHAKPPIVEAPSRPIRILFVFAWLGSSGEEEQASLLAKHLDSHRYRIDAVACFRRDGRPELEHLALHRAGVEIDTTPYGLSFDDTVRYLERKIVGYDIVVSCQNVADVYPALERLRHGPPLIEYGGLLSEALAGPKHFTTRFVGISDAGRTAAAARMSDGPHDAVEIPAMVDLSGHNTNQRKAVRATLGITPNQILFGFAGQLDVESPVEDFIRAAALVHKNNPAARFVVIGGPAASMPDYVTDLAVLAKALCPADVIRFLGDQPDSDDTLCALDVLVSLSRHEAMPDRIAKAGADNLPVIGTTEGDTLRYILDGVSGLLVPPGSAPAIAQAMQQLARDPAMRLRLGNALQTTIAATLAADVVIPKWEALFESVVAETPPASPPSLFQSFHLGGFEGSTHRLRNGERLDMVQSTGHADHAAGDYLQLRGHGIRAVRDSLRWHLAETGDGPPNLSSFRVMLEAAESTGTQVIWDLMHYGWPDDIDIWSPAFVTRFTSFARSAAEAHRDTTDAVPFWCPVNEISFFAWGGGDAGYLNPFAHGRGFELKVQLARASIAAMDALRDVDPRARFVHCEPMISIHHDPSTGRPYWEAEGWHQAQFQAFELLMGRMWPQIGGHPDYLDIIGVNYYFNNQWVHAGPAIDIGHPLYRPLSDLLCENYARYHRPILIAETGIEGERRRPWFDYVADEVQVARKRGIPVEGICLYPIVNHKGWDDDRLCENGLLSHVVVDGRREPYGPLASALQHRAMIDSTEPALSRSHVDEHP